MMIEVECHDCHCTSSLAGFLLNRDLKGTPFEHLLEDPSFDVTKWQEQMIKEGRAEYKDGFFWCDGIRILDEHDRFLETETCPECGSKNVVWY